MNLNFEIDKIMNHNSLIHDDCFNVLPKIQESSIDFILCDLPYGMTNCKWDTPIDLEKLWKEYKRIIKPRGVICLFAQTPFDKILGVSNIKWLKYEWIWEKTQATGFFNAKKMPLKAHENILIFYNKAPKFFPQKTTGHKPMNYYTKKADVQNKTTIYGKANKDVSGGGETERYPRTVQVFSSDKQKTKLDGTIHPTQKPIKLLEFLIKSYTQKGDLILDNCAGSSSTGVAAFNLERRFIMIEKELEWINVSKKRFNLKFKK